MKKNYLIVLLITVLIITGATIVIAKPDGTGRHSVHPPTSPLARIDLSAKQTEKIRELRLEHEQSIAPLKLEEYQVKAELAIFWLQMTLDMEKVKSAQKKIHDIRFQILEKETDYRIAVRKVLTENQLSRFLVLGGDRDHGLEKYGHHPPRPIQPEKY